MIQNSLIIPKPTKLELRRKEIEEILKKYRKCLCLTDFFKLSTKNKKKSTK